MENSAIYCDGVKIDFEQPILDSLDLKVSYGSIYGLVGASGCGKTTLIRCIWGYYKPKYGTVRTLGHRPDANSLTSLIPGPTIGYMPQDVSLDLCLTAKEILIYFGKCYDITNEVLNQKLRKFKKVLKISDLNMKVDHLSSGQFRRLSFVCSVIHEPSLLLLDEPTVGLDPVTREFMWEYISEQRDQNGVTVLVTTHYIDELIYADSIGIMQDGKIQLEVNPSLARSRFPGMSLSSIIIQLMYSDNRDSTSTRTRNNIIDSNQILPVTRLRSTEDVLINKKVPMNDSYFLPFIYRQSKLTQRLIILPAFIACFCHFISIITFFNIYGSFGEDSISLAIIDPANQSKVLIDMNPINKVLAVFLENELEGIEAVESRKHTGYILFAEDFEVRMHEWVECLFKNHPSCTGKHVGIARYRGDYSNLVLSEYALWILDESFRNIALNLSKSIHGDSRLIDFIKTEAMIDIPDDESYSKARHELVWRLLLHISFCNSLFVLGMILVSDKKSSIVERQLAIGYKKHKIIFYHLIWNILVALITTYINYFTTVPFVALVNVKNSNAFPLLIITILTIISVLASHILVEFIPNFAVLSIFNLFSIVLGFSIGRILRPSNTIPYYATYLSNLFPSSAGGDAVVAVIIQGMDFSADKVLWSLIELIVQLMAYFLVLMLKVFYL